MGGMEHPFTMESILDIPLTMDEEKKKLASIVHSVTVEELSRISKPEISSPPKSTIEASKANLKKILKLFKQTHDARDGFVENFPIWKILRLENIKQLEEVAEVIHIDKKGCSVGKVVGGVAGVTGAAVTIGALLFPPAAPAILPAWLGGAAAAAYLPACLLPAAAPVLGSFAVGGGVATGIGGVTMVGATVAEVALLRKRMEEAKKVLEADQMAFQFMDGWFRHSYELIEAVETVMGFDALKSWMDDLNTSLSWFKDFQMMGDEKFDLFKSVLRLVIRRVLPCMVLGSEFELIPEILSFLFIVFWLHKENQSLLNSIVRMQSMISHLRRFLDDEELGRRLTAMGANSTSIAEIIALALARRTAMGVFAGVGFVFNIANVVLTIKSIQNDSQCQQANEVKNVARNLKEEYDALEKVYHCLVRGI